MAFGRSFRDNPAAWIALGVVGVLAIPPVRKALRAATVSAAVGVLKIGDGLAHMGGRVTQEASSILTDAADKREQWRRQADPAIGESWFRKTVVGGLASTFSAADTVSHGARQAFLKGRSAVQMETGEMGNAAQFDTRTATGDRWQAAEPTADLSVASKKTLPEHLMPTSLDANTAHPHTGRHVPGDLAIRNPEAFMQFAEAVQEVGAGLKPEYENLLTTVSKPEP